MVRQKSEQFEADLSEAFDAVGLRVRNDSRNIVPGVPLQDILSSAVTGVVIPLLRLMVGERDPSALSTVTRHLFWLHDADAEKERRRISDELGTHVDRWRQRLADNPPNSERADALATTALEYLGGLETFRSIHPAYRDKWLLESTFDGLRQHLRGSCNLSNWPGVFDRFSGHDAVSLLTIHKSKGLEYDTVILLGLDDTSWWSHRPGDREGASTLFVAISRARQRMLFSHAHTRGATQKVSDLYELLTSAGFPERHHDPQVEPLRVAHGRDVVRPADQS